MRTFNSTQIGTSTTMICSRETLNKKTSRTRASVWTYVIIEVHKCTENDTKTTTEFVISSNSNECKDRQHFCHPSQLVRQMKSNSTGDKRTFIASDHLICLANTMRASQRLKIIVRVPVGVVNDDRVRCRQVDALYTLKSERTTKEFGGGNPRGF